ncbi:alpha/beta hydrolase [Amycolatopsis acidicola]|uniref:Alpha/beta hydrolase n=1 Tax=Amycolatopsis acidicola TaxID=2596893 RepID=A0A5N0V2D1_9PSEU|nr:alpha/beta hydrolase [Amycolatopsis acidicola]KAA9158567.1 alpha/beta hydrolase [Amycolatopsis acidicola]
MDFVLIHGTTQSPAGWGRLVRVLEKRGHRAVTVDLPTNRPELLSEDYARCAVEQTDVDSPVVIGHSGAGLVLPAVGAALKARRLVWLAAAVPSELPFLSEMRAAAAEVVTPEWRGLEKPPASDPVVAAYFLFHDCDLATLRWALPTVRTWYPRGVYGETVTGEPLPSTYVLPTGDRTLRPEWMRRVARERLGVEPVEVPGGHCPHVSRPELVADIVS